MRAPTGSPAPSSSSALSIFTCMGPPRQGVRPMAVCPLTVSTSVPGEALEAAQPAVLPSAPTPHTSPNTPVSPWSLVIPFCHLWHILTPPRLSILPVPLG